MILNECTVQDENKLTKIKNSLESRVVTLPDGTSLPRIGQGTWYMGENPQMREREICWTGANHIRFYVSSKIGCKR